jgi:GT2 family glycosyltransferase
MRLAVGIATIGRPLTLTETLKEIAKQKRLPDLVVLCPATSNDIHNAELDGLPFPTRIVLGQAGSAPQRNAILLSIAQYDAVVFFDDDFFPSRNYLANAETILGLEADVVVATGTIIEDGINGPGLTPDYARERLTTVPVQYHAGNLTPDYGTYGCNTVVRLAPVREHGIEFDEALPLYAWQEDIDFSRQLAAFGRIVRSDALTGIHLGVKRGRTSGVRLGYSQVANPIYLMRKGTMSLSFGSRTMTKNLLANLIRSLRPEAHVDRRGRLKGNLLAFLDLARGRLHPRRILEIDS